MFIIIEKSKEIQITSSSRHAFPVLQRQFKDKKRKMVRTSFVTTKAPQINVEDYLSLGDLFPFPSASRDESSCTPSDHPSRPWCSAADEG
jgi:hypothetical protein